MFLFYSLLFGYQQASYFTASTLQIMITNSSQDFDSRYGHFPYHTGPLHRAHMSTSQDISSHFVKVFTYHKLSKSDYHDDNQENKICMPCMYIPELVKDNILSYHVFMETTVFISIFREIKNRNMFPYYLSINPKNITIHFLLLNDVS